VRHDTNNGALQPEGDFVDLGKHRVKDLTRPEHLYQLGSGEFPPLRSLNLVSLPLQPTPLVGRASEVAAIIAATRRGDDLSNRRRVGRVGSAVTA